LVCLADQPIWGITARDITRASGANLGSIGHHFGSKNALLAEALAESFRQWTVSLAEELTELNTLAASHRLPRTLAAVYASANARKGLVRAFFGALALMPHEPALREALADSYRRGRNAIASTLGLRQSPVDLGAASIALAIFDGLLIQMAIDEQDSLQPDIVVEAIQRLLDSTDEYIRGERQ
jgi:AcrR family transcriptional regulator